jgi:hypothetical protein
MVTSLFGLQTTASAEQSIPDFANRVAVVMESNLTNCGLFLIDPRTPGLPNNTRWNARYAVVNGRGQALAYFVQDYGVGAVWTWMNPNGSFRHSIQFDHQSIRFVTPYAGNVASASRFVTPGGVGFNMYCRSAGGMVPQWQMFESCVGQDFVQVITNQLCQYAQ